MYDAGLIDIECGTVFNNRKIMRLTNRGVLVARGFERIQDSLDAYAERLEDEPRNLFRYDSGPVDDSKQDYPIENF